MSDAGMRIAIFLGVVGALVGVHLWLGSRAADLAEKKGYSRHFGFLMGFYFSVIGYFLLNRMKPDEEELRLRAEQERAQAQAEEIAQLEGRKEAPPIPWQFVYSAGKRPRFGAAYLLLGAGLAASLFLSYRPEEVGGKSADLNLIPRAELNGWKYGGDIPLDSETDKQIKADATTMRRYISPTGQIVDMYLVYRRYGRREFNHNPDQCFPAGGFVLKTRDVVGMPWAGGEREAVHMVFDGSKVERMVQRPDGKVDTEIGMPETTVSYLFASGKKTEHVFLKQQLWMALERIVPNKNGWTLIRLTTYHTTNAADALAAQKEFMKVYGPEIQKAITTDSEEERTAAASDRVFDNAAVAVQ
jgi:EpsI family protein